MSTDRETFDRAYGVRTDGQIHMGALNLDGMPEEDLRIVAEHPALHSDVKTYARIATMAKRCRLAGDITKAIRYEARLEKIYAQIPRALKW